ncbi:MAG: hypothetical protein AAF628_21885 [Planctomycetota bacterium]
MEPEGWTPVRRILLRFGLLYFLIYAHPFPLYCLPTPTTVAGIFDAQPEWVSATGVIDEALADYQTWFVRQERRAVDAVAGRVLGIEYVLDRPYGSGDPLYSYIRMMLHVLATAVGTAIWSWVARPRGTHERLVAWALIGLRFWVALAMLSYGLSKILPTQFPPFLKLDRLLAPYGDSTPMSVLWSAMRSSEAYTFFGGAGEVAAGVLLLFRRTATLGALAGAGVMANVVAMNFCFDVPVKLYSSHLLLGAVAIAAPDARRLFAMLIRNRATSPRAMRYPHLPVTGAVLKTLVVAAFVVPGIRGRLERMEAYDDLPQHYGIWDVEEFEVDGELRPLLAADVGIWKHLVIDRGDRCSIHRMDGTRMQQQLAREADGEFTLTTSSAWEVEVAGDRMLLTGQFAWRFLGDLGDETSSLGEENRAPQLRWTLIRKADPATADGPQGDGPDPAPTATAAGSEPWLGAWQAQGFELLGDRHSPRSQPAPARFTELEFREDGALRVTLPTGRIDDFRWERTADARVTLELTATGRFRVERADRTMRLDGDYRGHRLRVSLAARDLSEFHLLRRGFHWVNPIPWNRF